MRDTTDINVSFIVNNAKKYIESDYEKSRQILLDGLSKYTDNEILLNNLLYVSADDSEIIEIATKLSETAKNNSVKYDALRFLAYAYKRIGEHKKAEEAIEKIPDLTFTKLTELAFLFDDERRYSAAEKQKYISMENTIQMMHKLSEYYESISEYDKAIVEIENALKLILIENNSRFETYIDFFEKRIFDLKKN